MTFKDYLYPPAIAAGFAAVLIGYSSSAMIISNALHTAVAQDSAREAAVITFVVTASGVSLFGVGAAFWGLVAGALATFIFNRRSE